MRSLLHWILFALAMADWTASAPAAQPLLFERNLLSAR